MIISNIGFKVFRRILPRKLFFFSTMTKESRDGDCGFNIDNFYLTMQGEMKDRNEMACFRYLTSRSTKENVSEIELLCNDISRIFKHYKIPTKGVFLRKTESSVKAFKYLFCNTNFASQALLANDTGSGNLVNKQPRLPPYLLIEILWHVHFEDILAESMLYFPLDICIEILEILPRCIDLLKFQRASKFLSILIPNAYKKMIILRDTGCHTKDITGNAKKLVGLLQELILLFTNERFLKLEGVPKSDQYKRYGTLLKTIIKMVSLCLTTKTKNVKLCNEMEKMYELTFGPIPLEKIDDRILQDYLIEIDRELMNLLLKKVKEIDCNIYLNWTEYDDEENTSLTLQRAIGLQSYYFIENTKEPKNSNIQEYNHLIECLKQIASKPDSNNSLESLQLVDLSYGVSEGKKDYILALFKRYKEWDNSVIDAIDSNISFIDKDTCYKLVENFAVELNQAREQINSENLQLYALCLAKALVSLKITELYEIAIQFILKFEENDNLENIIDISNFEKFIVLNPDLSIAKNLRVVLFFLCLDTRSTLKILLKMTIGHSDYPDVALNIDHLMLLQPILKIQMNKSTSDIMREALKTKCTETEEGYKMTVKPENCNFIIEDKKPESVSLVVRILQDICLEGPGWNANKFADLLQMLYSFCKVSEVVNEVLVPFLMSDSCSLTYLKYILVELHRLFNRYDSETSIDLVTALEKKALHLVKSNHISKYVIEDVLGLITGLVEHLCSTCIDGSVYRPFNFDYDIIFYCFPTQRLEFGKIIYRISLSDKINHFISLHQRKISYDINYLHLVEEDVIRYLFLKCTKKQYMKYTDEIITSYHNTLKWANKLDICDNIIRLTLESCLLCLEYPEIGPPDTLGYCIHCLTQLLPLIPISTNKQKKNKFYRGIYESLDKHITILKPSIEHTVIADAYNELLEHTKKSQFMIYLDAFNQFGQKCVQESDKLTTFKGVHSPMAIKLWLAHDLITETLNEAVTQEEYMRKCAKYFKKEHL